MPADQSSWFDNDQSAAPIEEASELGKGQAIRSCRRLGSFLAFLNKASCLRKNRFSAASSAAGEKSSAEAEAVRNDNLEPNREPRNLPEHA
jgi:hypothetical protein